MGLTDRIGVAISTTGEPHRLAFLAEAVHGWWKALAPLGLPTTVFVTVDGSEVEARRVAALMGGFAQTYKVGQGWPESSSVKPRSPEGRMGVAVNKNTGLELLMNDRTGCPQGQDWPTIEHLFLSDDDTYPLRSMALELHTRFEYPHSMVCWGKGRLDYAQRSHAAWKWPRGVVLYARRDVVARVGGMDEAFGLGGHEHAEWSRRIHQHGITPDPFVTPEHYARDHIVGKAHGAASYWHAEDMPRPGEHSISLGARRRQQTTVSRKRDWDKINAVMTARDGDTSFVPFRADANGRASATLI